MVLGTFLFALTLYIFQSRIFIYGLAIRGCVREGEYRDKNQNMDENGEESPWEIKFQFAPGDRRHGCWYRGVLYQTKDREGSMGVRKKAQGRQKKI